MSSTMRSASREANVRIVAVALIAAIVVVLAGLNARVNGRIDTRVSPDQAVIKISQHSAPAVWRAPVGPVTDSRALSD